VLTILVGVILLVSFILLVVLAFLNKNQTQVPAMGFVYLKNSC
jgi:hypothetical protein